MFPYQRSSRTGRLETPRKEVNTETVFASTQALDSLHCITQEGLHLLFSCLTLEWLPPRPWKAYTKVYT